MVIAPVSIMSVIIIFMVPPLFICFMLIVPMVLVPVVVAIANEFLVGGVSSEIAVCSTMFPVMQVSLRLVQYNLLGMVQIVSSVPWG
jgi:hypothetical protein